MKKYLFVAFLVASLYFPTSHLQIPEEQITISIDNDGGAKVVHRIDTETLLSNIHVNLVSDKISRAIAIDENNVLLNIRHSQNQTQIDTLGASQVTLSYDANLVTKTAKIWKLDYQSDLETSVILPAAANVISFNKIPTDIINDAYVMPKGEISLTFLIEPLKTHTFSVNRNGDAYQIAVITTANVENFIQKSQSIQFSIDDNVSLLAVVPKPLLSTQYDVFFENEKIDFKQFNQNSTHYWIRIDTPTPGTFLITSQEKAPTDGTTGGCLIATAIYGTELSPHVQQLREIRDDLLLTDSGSTFISGFNAIYYVFSPTISDWERQNPVFKEVIKLTITPLLATLSLLNYADLETEYQLMAYGIGIIFLNLVIYFVSPVLAASMIRKQLRKIPGQR